MNNVYGNGEVPPENEICECCGEPRELNENLICSECEFELKQDI